jgi:hypothetical protein
MFPPWFCLTFWFGFWVGQKATRHSVQMIDAIGGNLTPMLGLGENEGALDDGLG